MKRREFVRAVGRTAGLVVGSDLLGLMPFVRRSAGPALLSRWDDANPTISRRTVSPIGGPGGIKAEWLLNYRGGSSAAGRARDPARRGARGRERRTGGRQPRHGHPR